MALITKQNLESGIFRPSDWNSSQRGKAYYREGRAEILEFDGESTTCRVRGQDADYTVVISAENRTKLRVSCNCPQAARSRMCKHMVAAAIKVNEYIDRVAGGHWEYRLLQALENTPRLAASQHKKKTFWLAALGLYLSKQNENEYTGSLVPLRVDASLAPEGLDANERWYGKAEILDKRMEVETALNLSEKALQLYNLIASGLSPYGFHYGYNTGTDSLKYLPLIQTFGIPLYLFHERKLSARLQIAEQPATLETALGSDGKTYTLQMGTTINGKIYTLTKGSLRIIVNSDNSWVLADNILAPLANPGALQMLPFLPITIPQGQESAFREKYFSAITERMPVVGDVITWQEINEAPVPRLYLTRSGDEPLKAALRFGYADQEIPAHPKPSESITFDIPNSWSMIKVNRQTERELHFYNLLTDSQYGLKRAGAGEPGMFEIRARTHPYDFLMRCIPALTQAGFEIYGEKDLGKVNRHVPTIQLNISSGIDWFDVQAIVQYGDQQVRLQELKQALKRGEKYIKLADGSVGQIPPEWQEKYKHLFHMAEETEAGLRLTDQQIPLLDEMLAEATETSLSPEFTQKRERLKQFEQIAPQPLPSGFTGELRPYQHAGLDWLHFLRRYNFGGILADDMGLGKTIQVLAFLQSIKEQEPGGAACLLIVPKSLLANWQRETAKFTPQLRILEFVGNTRKKEVTLFNEYDIILTTYGTMLRDIEFLRQYRFQYVILDESQAIKNPLAQSSKASRLLNAGHRIAITGTPVENNTFELWSQFAFTNPGLLGNLEYFKTEFASPIENREQENANASLLKRMIYPFILRRTKEQVAPELPPRTEKIIYTDLEPAQRKLYNHTREYYRNLLAGILEDEGLNNARMKVLEGLLRLRQICIHPRLVEPTYRGEAAKFEVLLETLETLRQENHKALIFSQFVQTLHLLRGEMEYRHIPYAYLDGQTRDRQAVVDEFQENASIPFFLISLKAGGVGLNLTAADYVIHLDPWWNPAVEMQATDRAHRIGQDKPVFVYKIIARDTVEEKILQLQERKRELVEQLISAEGGFFKSLTREDVNVLFS